VRVIKQLIAGAFFLWENEDPVVRSLRPDHRIILYGRITLCARPGKQLKWLTTNFRVKGLAE